MSLLEHLQIKIFADGADIESMIAMYSQPYIKGFTTNPTLMRKAGVSDYEAFARELLGKITDRPVSLEVFADDPQEMKAQAFTIASWGHNVNVKIPVTSTEGRFCGEVIRDLSGKGVVVNVTAVFSVEQVKRIAAVLNPDVPAIVSVFAGRIADTGVDPVPIMREAKEILSVVPKAELLWASPREVLNVIQANEIGCDIITATTDILAKLKCFGKGLDEFSLETVCMFYRDALAANFKIKVGSETMLH